MRHIGSVSQTQLGTARVEQSHVRTPVAVEQGQVHSAMAVEQSQVSSGSRTEPSQPGGCVTVSFRGDVLLVSHVPTRCENMTVNTSAWMVRLNL